METVTINKVYLILQEMNCRLKTIEMEMTKLKAEPELRQDYIDKAKKTMDEKPIHIGTVDNLRKRLKVK